MNRKVMNYFVIAALFSGLLFAGEPAVDRQKFMKVVTPEMEAAQLARVDESGVKATPVHEARCSTGTLVWQSDLGTTIYDYAATSVTGRHAAKTSSNNIHTVFSKRPASGGDRFVTYNYADNGFQFVFGEASITEAMNTGGQRVVNGESDQGVFSFSGGGVWLFKDAGEAFYTFYNAVAGGGPVGSGGFPGHAIDENGGIHYVYASSAGGGFTTDSYVYSADGGATFSVPTWPVNAISENFAVGNTEVWPLTHSSSVGFFATIHDPGQGYPGGLAWYRSDDFGATWESSVILEETDWFTDSQGGSQSYLVENFSQFNSLWASDGTVHLAFNGYGLHALDGDTTFIFPTVYWNNRDSLFLEMTGPEFSTQNPELSEAILSGYSGNGIGNAYPTLSASIDGQRMAIYWQQPELADNGLPDYPNPFNPQTYFGFRVSDFGLVDIHIFDVQGRLIKTVVSEQMAPGNYTASWDSRDDQGNDVTSGVYFYRLTVAGQFNPQSSVRKMILLR